MGIDIAGNYLTVLAVIIIGLIFLITLRVILKKRTAVKREKKQIKECIFDKNKIDDETIDLMSFQIIEKIIIVHTEETIDG